MAGAGQAMYFLKPAGGKVEVDTVVNTVRPTPARTTPMPAALALASRLVVS